jgi:hypothetical protein
MPSSYEVVVSIPQNGVSGRKFTFQAALPVGEAFHKISTVKRAAREFSARPRLCVPCTWGADVWMNVGCRGVVGMFVCVCWCIVNVNICLTHCSCVCVCVCVCVLCMNLRWCDLFFEE